MKTKTLKLWKVHTGLNVNRKDLSDELKKHGAFLMGLQPTKVSRMESRNGLLCHRDEEYCYFAEGPTNLPKLVANNSIVSGVI